MLTPARVLSVILFAALVAVGTVGAVVGSPLTGPGRATAPAYDCGASPLTVAEPRLMDHEGWLATCGADAPGGAVKRITEDDPRWNCATMGNRVCGPVTAGPVPS